MSTGNNNRYSGYIRSTKLLKFAIKNVSLVFPLFYLPNYYFTDEVPKPSELPVLINNMADLLVKRALIWKNLTINSTFILR